MTSQNTRKLDSRGRLLIKNDYLTDLERGESSLYVATNEIMRALNRDPNPGFNRVCLYQEDVFSGLLEKLPDSVQPYFRTRSYATRLDSQRRILINQEFRDYASILNDAI